MNFSFIVHLQLQGDEALERCIFAPRIILRNSFGKFLL